MRYTIGSGWWSPPSDGEDSRSVLNGCEYIRSPAFHNDWIESISRFSNPEKIVIVDSNSPRRPEPPLDGRIEFLSLPFNAGHATNHTGTLSGWTRSVILGLSYAQMSDCDYFVYVEQDALLFGDGIVEKCIQAMRRPFMFGDGAGTPQQIQQSFFIIRKDGFESFRHRLVSIVEKDIQVSPERKFALGSSRLPTRTSAWLGSSGLRLRIAHHLLRRFPQYDVLPIGYGRARPIDWSDSHLYFQWGSEEELVRYRRRADVA